MAKGEAEGLSWKTALGYLAEQPAVRTLFPLLAVPFPLPSPSASLVHLADFANRASLVNDHPDTFGSFRLSFAREQRKGKTRDAIVSNDKRYPC